MTGKNLYLSMYKLYARRGKKLIYMSPFMEKKRLGGAIIKSTLDSIDIFYNLNQTLPAFSKWMTGRYQIPNPP